MRGFAVCWPMEDEKSQSWLRLRRLEKLLHDLLRLCETPWTVSMRAESNVDIDPPSGASTKTPTGYCVNISRKAQVCQVTPKRTWTKSSGGSINVHERHWDFRPQRLHWRQVLRSPLESTLPEFKTWADLAEEVRNLNTAFHLRAEEADDPGTVATDVGRQPNGGQEYCQFLLALRRIVEDTVPNDEKIARYNS
jgi:hypothetical protein